MSRKKISTTIYIRADQDDRLKRLQARTHVPTSERIRQAIDCLLDALGEKVSTFEATPEDGRFDLAGELRRRQGAA